MKDILTGLAYMAGFNIYEQPGEFPLLTANPEVIVKFCRLYELYLVERGWVSPDLAAAKQFTADLEKSAESKIKGKK